MNIPFYKNHWYYLAIFTFLVIIFIAYRSTEIYNVSLVSSTGNYTFTLEFFLRIFFNPLWVVSVFFYEKGEKLNSQYHYDILKYLQGVVMGAMDSGEKKILTSTLADALINHNNIESKIRKSLDKGINMKTDRGNPIL